jgi:NAD(P)-dependent dehydrogenase (short-subunit alcohol dehydrogenase family)
MTVLDTTPGTSAGATPAPAGPESARTVLVTGGASGLGAAVAAAVTAAGGRALVLDRVAVDSPDAIQVDLADARAAERAVTEAAERAGGLDAVVTAAGIDACGELLDVDPEAWERVVAVNLRGPWLCGQVVARDMVAGGRAGTIVNVGSVVSDRAVPLLGIYSASKQAVQGYTDALRMELEEEGAPISITLIKPSATNTPFIEHAGNYMEAEPEFPPPVYAPEVVARAILRCAVKPTREITVGGAGKVLTAMGAVAPRLTDLYMESTMFDQQKRDEPPRSDDALYESQRDGSRRGPTERITLNRSAYTRAALSDVGRAIPAIAAGALLVVALRRRSEASEAA